MPVEVSVSCSYSFVTFLIPIVFFNKWKKSGRNFVFKLIILKAEQSQSSHLVGNYFSSKCQIL